MIDKTVDKCPNCNSPKTAMVQWQDTTKPNATWIECEHCSFSTTSFHSVDPEEAIKKAKRAWKRRPKKKRSKRPKAGVLLCPCCGNEAEVESHNLYKKERHHWIKCTACKSFIDVLPDRQNVCTKKEAINVWYGGVLPK